MIKKLYPKRKHLAQYSARVDGFSRHLEPRGSERGGRGRRWAEPHASSPHSARGASANLNPARQPRKLSFRDAPDKVPGVTQLESQGWNSSMCLTQALCVSHKNYQKTQRS